MTAAKPRPNARRWWGRPLTMTHVVVDAAAAAFGVFVTWYGFGGGDIDGLVGAGVVFVGGTCLGVRNLRRGDRR